MALVRCQAAGKHSRPAGFSAPGRNGPGLHAASEWQSNQDVTKEAPGIRSEVKYEYWISGEGPNKIFRVAMRIQSTCV